MAYADDVIMIVKDKNSREIEYKAEEAFWELLEWMRKHQLQIEPNKTRAIVCKGWRRPEPIVLTLGDHIIQPGKTLKYLGLIWDERNTFSKHIMEIKEKTGKTNKMLQAIKPNIRGPNEHKRRIITGITTSIVTCGAQIYQEIVQVQKYRNILNKIQRMTLLQTIQRNISTNTIIQIMCIDKYHWDKIILFIKNTITNRIDYEKMVIKR